MQLQIVVRNFETYTLSAGNARIYVKLERQSTHGNGACPTGFNQTPERDAWWMVDAGTNPAIPQDPYLWNSLNPTWPNNGGWAIPAAIASGTTLTLNFTVKLPAYGQQGVMYNTAYQFLVGSKSSNQGASDANAYVCGVFSTCNPGVAASSVVKRVDGTAANGNTMLYWLDYKYFNSSGSWVSDVLPPCLDFVRAAPQPYNGAAALWDPLTRRVTWRVEDSNTPVSNYVATGQLYVQVNLNGCSGSLTNTGYYCSVCSSTGPWTATPAVTQQIGAANVLLHKSQQSLGGSPIAEGALLADGSQVQYVLEYTLSGDALRCFDSFDSYAAQTYNVPSGAPAGFGQWSSDQGGATTWRITDEGDADHYLTFIGSGYHALLLDCPGSETAGQFCGGTVQVDMRHDQANDPNADALLILRSDGLPNGETYAVLLTGDQNPGTPGAHLKVQRCSGGACGWTNATNPAQALDGIWYTVKAVEVPGQPGHILAKFWERGQPEPANWMVNWTDPSTPFDCTPNPGGKFRPGVGGQAAKDDYNNFRVYSANQLVNASLSDPVPAGVDYVSSTPLASGTPSNNNTPTDAVRWDFTGNNFGALGGILYEGSGSFTWVARLDCSELQDQVYNQAQLRGQILPLPAQVALSNVVHLHSDCGTPTVTPTFSPSPTSSATPTVTASATPTATPSTTPTASPTLTATPSATATATPSATLTASPTLTATPSATSTATPTVTFTASPTFTATPSSSPSATPTATRSASPTPSATLTASATATETTTLTASPTATPSVTATPTFTDSPTAPFSPSATSTFSWTPTFTATASRTASSTRSASPSETSSATASPSFTSTPTVTASATASPSSSPTASATPSPTRSASPTASVTLTPSPSITPTLSSTSTWTASPTPSASPTLPPTPVPAPHHLILSVYNSAGERVKLLFDGAAQLLPGKLDLGGQLILGGEAVLNIGFPGLFYDPQLGWISKLAWAADNDNGQLVSGGVYVIKAELMDPFGSVTTLQSSVQVLPGPGEGVLEIYNSAGERVARPPLPTMVAGTRLIGVRLQQDSSSLRFYVKDEQGVEHVVLWDGLNEEGRLVASGTYIAKLLYISPDGARHVEARSFTILDSPSEGLAKAQVGPNPATDQDWQLSAPAVVGQSLLATAYDLAGARVACAASEVGAAHLRLPNQNLAAGVYLIVLERYPMQSSTDRRVFKVALIR